MLPACMAGSMQLCFYMNPSGDTTMKARSRITMAVLAMGACSVLSGCANLDNANARPGDYAANYFSAPLSSLYPGNYPQSAESSISSR